jgi:hypothetical protein
MTETRTCVGQTGTQAFDGTVHVSAVGALPGSGLTLKTEEWERWFEI